MANCSVNAIRKTKPGKSAWEKSPLCRQTFNSVVVRLVRRIFQHIKFYRHITFHSSRKNRRLRLQRFAFYTAWNCFKSWECEIRAPFFRLSSGSEVYMQFVFRVISYILLYSCNIAHLCTAQSIWTKAYSDYSSGQSIVQTENHEYLVVTF